MADEKDDDRKGDSLEASLKIDPTKGNVEGTVKINSFTKVLRAVFPEFTAKGRLKHAAVDDIERQLASGKSIGDLPKIEQMLIAGALVGELRKLANKSEIIERAGLKEPSVLELFEAPARALPPAVEPAAPPSSEPAVQSTESADQHQYFWERFWADAEVVSVAYFQDVYAGILAGQVKRPGSVSLRTLDVVRCLDERTGKLFSEVCQYELGHHLVPDIFGPNRLFSILELNVLADAGLMRTDKLATAVAPHSYSYGPWLLRLTTDSYLPLGLYPFTAAGRELLGMTPVEYTKERAVEVCKGFTSALKGSSPCEVCNRIDDKWVEWRQFFGLLDP